MIAVHSPLEIGAEPQGGWRLLLWAGHAFDYTTPFRAVLAEIADAVAQDRPSALQLPAYEEGEDFVEGTLQYGGDTLRLYYAQARCTTANGKMHPSTSAARFQSFILGRHVEVESAPLGESVAGALEFYRAERATGLLPTPQADMLLFQFGLWSSGPAAALGARS